MALTLSLFAISIGSGCATSIQTEPVAPVYRYEDDLQAQLEAANARRRARDEERRTAYLAANPGIPQQRAEDIRRGVIRIGMTADEVRAARGDPVKINRTVTGRSVHEQWIYGYRENRIYVYIDDGVFTSFQDSESVAHR